MSFYFGAGLPLAVFPGCPWAWGCGLVLMGAGLGLDLAAWFDAGFGLGVSGALGVWEDLDGEGLVCGGLVCDALGFTPLAWPCVPFSNALFGFPNFGGGPLGLVFPVEPLACEVFSLAALARSNCSNCARFHSNSFIFSSGIAHFTCGFVGFWTCWICPGWLAAATYVCVCAVSAYSEIAFCFSERERTALFRMSEKSFRVALLGSTPKEREKSLVARSIAKKFAVEKS